MYDDHYISQPRGVPLVAFHKKIKMKALSQRSCVFTHAHYHGDTEMLFIEEGEGEFYINGTQYEFKAGNFIMINPYELHYATMKSHLSYYCVDFDMKMLSSVETTDPVAKYVEGEWKLSHFCSGLKGVSEAITEICSVYEGNLPGRELKLKGLLFLILARIEQEGLYEKPDSGKDNEMVRKIYDYVQRGYRGNITSKDAAAYFQYNHSYFCRLFRRNFGSSFGEFVNRFRIKKARIFMENGTEKIADIASFCGFNSISYFSELFKQFNGMTPTQYIRLCRG